MRTPSRRNHARGNSGLTLDATLRVVDCARIYRKPARGNLRAARRLLKEARCIGTITAPTALYGIAHRVGNEVEGASSLWLHEPSVGVVFKASSTVRTRATRLNIGVILIALRFSRNFTVFPAVAPLPADSILQISAHVPRAQDIGG